MQCTISSGSCSVVYTSPSVSINTLATIKASYPGDAVHSGGSGGFIVQVSPRPVSVSVNCNPNNISPLATSSCTVTVQDHGSGPQVVPTGTVSFSSNAGGTFSPTQCTLASGICTSNYTAPSVSTQITATITASYPGDDVHGGGSGTAGVQITPRTVSVSLNCSPNSIAPVSDTRCTVTVKDTGPGPQVIPSGSVNFKSSAGGSFTPPQCALSAGSCSVTFTSPAVTSSTNVAINATYPGDAVHSGGSSTTNVQVSPRQVSVSVACNPGTVASLGSTTCTVTVQDTGPGTPITPTGTVTFSSNGGGTFSSTHCALSSGSCSVTYTAPLVLNPTGVTITATYAGDTVHYGGTNHTNVNVI